MSLAEIGPVQLGKKAAVQDKRTLKLADYLTYADDVPPSQAHWGHGLTFAMDGNDQYGDCVEAAYAHQAQVWSARTRRPFSADASEVLAAYSAITGFNPDDPSTDQGTDMLTAVKYWKSSGMGGVKVDAFASVHPDSHSEIQESIAFYGGLYVGLQLPLSAQNQVGTEWTVTSGPDAQAGSWGGHCINLTGYDPRGLWGITWGQFQRISWSFLTTYCDEAYVLLSQEWVAASGTSPSGLAWGQLMADLANL